VTAAKRQRQAENAVGKNEPIHENVINVKPGAYLASAFSQRLACALTLAGAVPP